MWTHFFYTCLYLNSKNISYIIKKIISEVIIKIKLRKLSQGQYKISTELGKVLYKYLFDNKDSRIFFELYVLIVGLIIGFNCK